MLGAEHGQRYAVAVGGDDGLYAYEVQTGFGLRMTRTHDSGFSSADEAETAARAWIAANPLNTEISNAPPSAESK
jgi:hypothetical protein